MMVCILQAVILDVHRSNGTIGNMHLGLAPHRAFLGTAEDGAFDIATIDIDIRGAAVALLKTDNLCTRIASNQNHITPTAAKHVTCTGVGQHP